jgi:aminoglycoside phosphotransferase (APT) family kinase protein
MPYQWTKSDWLQLAGRWLSANVEGFAGPIRDAQVATAGRSNVTLIVTDQEEHRFVVRLPPAGEHDHTAHDVCREARILCALERTGVPLPRVAAICDDVSVVGVPFFVMDFVEGRVLDTRRDGESIPHRERRALTRDVGAHLAAIHRVDPAAVGLDGLSASSGFIARQLRRWVAQWRGGGEAGLDARFSECHALLVERRPLDGPVTTLIHGDYRLGNMIVADGRVKAVLDWELTSLGHPLADLAYLLNNWVDASEADTGPITSPVAAGGFGCRADVVASYEQALGHEVERATLGYFRAFSYWRLASIRSGVLARLGDSSDSDEDDRLRQSAASIPMLVHHAMALLEREP